ncbi:hypothetical protein [Thalassospira sp.]|uniref:hypothetical protein n=1 Tax=Thalassospira sp. TaxID=1912094 RepID=UPI000C57D6DA|nr:hypothetical protein [Thalassospira sp.]MBC05351.1 hypothetical protein [Thalassospira sp.]|tara:strand:+ start:3657 stop:4421 length:765 start_codon:yes stop_codon:yes gene_type:complete
MKDKQLHALVLLLCGWLTGIVSSLIFLPSLSIVSDGWGSILGSAIGVFGAFFAAHLSFQWQEDAAHTKAMKPFHQRFALAIEKAPVALERLKELQPQLENLGNKLTLSNELRPEERFPEHDEGLTREELEQRKRISENNEDLKIAFSLVDTKRAQEVIERTQEIAAHFGWLKDNFQATLSPDQLRLVKLIHSNAESTAGCLLQSVSCIQNDFVYIRENKFRAGEEKLYLIDNSRTALSKLKAVCNALDDLKEIN